MCIFNALKPRKGHVNMTYTAKFFSFYQTNGVSTIKFIRFVLNEKEKTKLNEPLHA